MYYRLGLAELERVAGSEGECGGQARDQSPAGGCLGGTHQLRQVSAGEGSQQQIYILSQKIIQYFQGAARDGKTPDGSSYVEAAEKQEIKELLAN